MISRTMNAARRARRAGSGLVECLEGRRLLTTALHDLSTGNFSQDWSNAGLITVDDNWSGVASITGYRGDNDAVLTGANPQGVLLPNAVVDVNANRSDPDAFGTGGVAEFDGITNRTVALQGSGTADAPHLTIYLNASGRENLNISYNLRDVDASVANTNQQFALQYRLGGTGNFTDIPAGYIADASSGPSLATLVTPVNVALPAELAGQPNVELRVITTNAPGADGDEWVGVDDILVTSTAALQQFVGFNPTTVPPVAETAGTATVTVTRSSGTGTVTVNYATSDLPNGAIAGSDYTSTAGTLTFNPGETSKPINIPIANNPEVEPLESFRVTLSGVSGGPSGSQLTTSTIDVAITDDDKPTGGKLISAGPLVEDWNDTAQISTNDDWSGVPYFFGYRGDSTPDNPGVDPQTITAPLTEILDVNANITDSTTFFTGGVAEYDEPFIDPSITINGSGGADSPFILFEVDTTGVSSVDVSYNVRDMDYTPDNAVQQVALQYRIGNTGNFTNVPAGFVADATEGLGENDLVTPVAVTFNASSVIGGDIPNKSLVQFRVITANAVGGLSNFDEAVGIDDIVVQQTPVGPGVVSVGAPTVSVTEGTASVTLAVVRSGGSTGTVTVNYATANGSATAGADYTAASGTLTFVDGDTSESVVIPIANDTTAETPENFTFTISGGTATLGTNLVSTVTIHDNDLVKLSEGPLLQDWSNTNQITQSNNWNGVLGIRGYQGDGIGGTGQNPNLVTESGTDAPVQVFANMASPNGGTNAFTGGVGEFDTLPNPTVALQGSSNVAPFLLFEVDTTGVPAVDVSYNLRDIETNDPAVMEVVLQYRIGNSGTWTNVPEAYVADATEPVTDTKVTAVSVEGLTAVANQPVVQFRIMTVSEDGFDQWVGVDDIVIEAGVAPALPVWVQAGSIATWDDPSQTLTVTGATTIIANPEASGDLPIINATGADADIAINPASGLVIRAASLNLAGGSSAVITSLGGARTPANHRVLVLNGISIDASSQLNITDNDVIVDYTGSTPAGPIEADVASGYNGTGDWAGNGIVSSIAANDGNFAVGVADNAALPAPFGTAQGGPLFAGQEVDLSAVLIKFTHRADINLDGLITPDDSAIFGGNYDDGQFATWATGDMNYDGIFSPDDSAIFGGSYDESLLLI